MLGSMLAPSTTYTCQPASSGARTTARPSTAVTSAARSSVLPSSRVRLTRRGWGTSLATAGGRFGTAMRGGRVRATSAPPTASSATPHTSSRVSLADWCIVGQLFDQHSQFVSLWGTAGLRRKYYRPAPQEKEIWSSWPAGHSPGAPPLDPALATAQSHSSFRAFGAPHQVG